MYNHVYNVIPCLYTNYTCINLSEHKKNLGNSTIFDDFLQKQNFFKIVFHREFFLLIYKSSLIPSIPNKRQLIGYAYTASLVAPKRFNNYLGAKAPKKVLKTYRSKDL